ncbi:MAG: hypothetical protein V3R58_02565, partial [candidate division NC10 bacterium]
MSGVDPDLDNLPGLKTQAVDLGNPEVDLDRIWVVEGDDGLAGLNVFPDADVPEPEDTVYLKNLSGVIVDSFTAYSLGR